jgi:imidazolonepropionase-like amidohydrolase
MTRKIIKMKYQVSSNNRLNWISLILLLLVLPGFSDFANPWVDVDDEGTFLIYRRQSQIGEESYTITSDGSSILVKSLQGENERGRITGIDAQLRLDMDLQPTSYFSRRIANGDTTNIFRMELTDDKVSIWEKHFDVVTSTVPDRFYPLHSNIPAAMEMMLYQYCFKQGGSLTIPTLPRGKISIVHKGQDIAQIAGKEVPLDRYVVEGINWGGRTIWLDADKNLIALVKANTQIREIIKKGYEEALPLFISAHAKEQINALEEYTEKLKGPQAATLALVGGDVIDGLTDVTQKDMVVIVKEGRIAAMGSRSTMKIPEDAKVIDVSGKTLMPGLWDMHAHSNQVQWAPAYLAGGVTTIRDNGNEIEFATAFRDGIAHDGLLGPDILLAGMTDGAGAKGNGIIRARNAEEAREVVDLYHSKGYKQIKIYSSIQPDELKVLAEEGHKKGMTLTGHIPLAVGDLVTAVDLGMDMFSHDRAVFSAVFPEKTRAEIISEVETNPEIDPARIQKAIDFLLEHKITLDPTLNISVVRAMTEGSLLETIEPYAGRISYELWEGKRFRKGRTPDSAEKMVSYYTIGAGIVGKFFKAGVPIVAGTDNIVPVFSLYLEIETYQKLGGLTPFEALQTATIIPARAMGMDSETGTLEINKQADIAILDKNPLDDISNIRTVSAVITNGNYYGSNPLWEAADFLPRED